MSVGIYVVVCDIQINILIDKDQIICRHVKYSPHDVS